MTDLRDLPYYVEWGQHGWASLLSHALTHVVGLDLSGKRVLDVGARYGKISCLFAKMGAEVWAVDIQPSYLPRAIEEAKRHGVSDRIRWHYDAGGGLSSCPDGSFDLVFTKSVLVLMSDLEAFLRLLSTKLTPDGQVVFLENAYGHWLIHLARALKHRKWSTFSNASYFTCKHLGVAHEVFDVTLLKRSWIPPVYLIVGKKKSYFLLRSLQTLPHR